MCSPLSLNNQKKIIYFSGMFIKPYSKHNKSTGERYLVYKLCESYRRNGGTYHHIIVNFGKLEELESVAEKKLLAIRTEALIRNGGQTLTLDPVNEKVETLARYYYNEVCAKRRYDIARGKGEIEIVKLETLKNKDAREIGSEWLCKQAFDQLGIGDFFKNKTGMMRKYRWLPRIS